MNQALWPRRKGMSAMIIANVAVDRRSACWRVCCVHWPHPSVSQAEAQVTAAQVLQCLVVIIIERVKLRIYCIVLSA